MSEKEIDKILEFWFGELEDGFTKDNRGKLWYLGGEETDKNITKLFGILVKKAKSRELDGWKTTPKGRIALIILLDQFTRNIFRKTKEAFESDPYSRQLCKEGIKEKQDIRLPPVQRAFFYHPLEHSEDLKDQETCVELFEKLMDGVPNKHKKRINGFLNYTKQHRDLIKQFGRFPHRNKVLNRKSTIKEIKYLKEGNSFGQ